MFYAIHLKRHFPKISFEGESNLSFRFVLPIDCIFNNFDFFFFFVENEKKSIYRSKPFLHNDKVVDQEEEERF